MGKFIWTRGWISVLKDAVKIKLLYFGSNFPADIGMVLIAGQGFSIFGNES